MEGWGAGFATGIGVGFAVGLIVGTLSGKQKSWSELTAREKNFRIGLIALLSVSTVAGIVTLLVRM